MIYYLIGWYLLGLIGAWWVFDKPLVEYTWGNFFFFIFFAFLGAVGLGWGWSCYTEQNKTFLDKKIFRKNKGI